ncbi:MAG: group III truncated hemoglobin [Chitinophagaceae bacterium]|jgi:hemoglobin|nr:group III truncated hemoglobin [Chitinophagaceae bacterium]
MKQLLGREDIIQLVDLFYSKLQSDKLLDPFFEKVNWPKHLSIMYDFWENVIFQESDYSGNPMGIHKMIHSKNQISARHFKRWNKIFRDSVDELFEGENAELIKIRAENISNIMLKSFSKK